MSSLAKSIGTKLKNARLNQGFTQEDVALSLDMYREHVSQAERGLKLTLAKMERMAAAMGMKIVVRLESVK
jgi:transcriptional regulator with XRE-family HTH domain